MQPCVASMTWDAAILIGVGAVLVMNDTAVVIGVSTAVVMVQLQ